MQTQPNAQPAPSTKLSSSEQKLLKQVQDNSRKIPAWVKTLARTPLLMY